MEYPVSSEEGKVKIKPELMEKEKLYYCLLKQKVLLFYKDSDEILNCYEIEEIDLVNKVNEIKDKTKLEKILEDYIQGKNLKI